MAATIKAGGESYKRTVTADQNRVAQVIGTNRTAELVAALDEIFAAVLAAE